MIYLIGLYVQIVLQFGLAYISFKTYRLLNHGNYWWILTTGFILMAIRRITALMTYETGSSLTAQLDKLLLPLTISILLFIGMIKMYLLAKRERNKHDLTKSKLKELKDLTFKLTKKSETKSTEWSKNEQKAE